MTSGNSWIFTKYDPKNTSKLSMNDWSKSKTVSMIIPDNEEDFDDISNRPVA